MVIFNEIREYFSDPILTTQKERELVELMSFGITKLKFMPVLTKQIASLQEIRKHNQSVCVKCDEDTEN